MFSSVALGLLVLVAILFPKSIRIRETLEKLINQEALREVYTLSLKSHELLNYSWNPSVKLNEFSFYYPDQHEQFEEREYAWVELFNEGNDPYNLAGHILMIEGDRIKSWSFPNRNIDPRGYLIITLSGKDHSRYYDDLHTSFFAGVDDKLIFGKVCGQDTLIIDSLPLKNLPYGKSFARIPDGKEFVYNPISPGLPNNRAGMVLMMDDKRIDNHIHFRDVFSRFGARMTFCINASYRCQFYNTNNPFGLIVDFGDSLSPQQAGYYENFISDGHEIGNHHYSHVSADKFIKKHGIDAYLKTQIYAMDSLFSNYQLPRIKSFVYSNHNRNNTADSVLNLRYFNYRGITNPTAFYRWDNTRLLSGLRLDHNAEIPGNMYDLIINKMPALIDSGGVMIAWGHGVTDSYKGIQWYTSDRTLKLIMARTRELGLKFYTQSELYALTKPLKLMLADTTKYLIRNNGNFQPIIAEITNISEHPINIMGFYLNKNMDFNQSYQITTPTILHPAEKLRVAFTGNADYIDTANIKVPIELNERDRLYLLWPDQETILERVVVGEEVFIVDSNLHLGKGQSLIVPVFNHNMQILPNNDFSWYGSDDTILRVHDNGEIFSYKPGVAEIAIKSKISGRVIKSKVLVD